MKQKAPLIAGPLIYKGFNKMKMSIVDFFEALQIKAGIVGKITLTKTMLEKHIIDANKSVIALAQSVGISYADLKAGEKVTIGGRFDCDGKACSVCFYRTKNRDDKRFSISGLKARAGVGNVIAITCDESGALVINASKAIGGVGESYE